MTSRVRVDLQSGTFEAEGTEEFVRVVYKEFQERVGRDGPLRPSSPPSAEHDDLGRPRKPNKPGSEKKVSSSSARDRMPVLVKELDLVTKGDRVGLKDFLKTYKLPSGAPSANGFFVYYLSRVAEVDKITLDHVYTCYKHVSMRVPKVLTQSLWDTARRKGWIDTTSLDDIKVTTAGENWVEHDLEKVTTG